MSTSVSLGLVLGCSLGAAVCLLVLALVPPRPALASLVGRWERQRAQQARLSEPGTRNGRQVRIGRTVVDRLARHGITLDRLRADLAITDSSFETHVVRKIRSGLIGLLLPSVTVLLMLTTGVRPPVAVPALLGLGLGALMFWLPDVAVAQAASRRRADMRRALSCYLDLVAMSLAGGRGIPEALPTAARIGQGWAFETISSTIDRARLVGDTPWTALAELGQRTGIRELQDLGGALQLVSDDGAKVRDSLTARAATQRRRQLAEAEGAAERADQSIQVAQVILAVGFFLFLAYPAVVAVTAV